MRGDEYWEVDCDDVNDDDDDDDAIDIGVPLMMPIDHDAVFWDRGRYEKRKKSSP